MNSEISMAVVDIHTHMLILDWIELLRANGGKYSVKKTPGNQDAVHLYDAPFMTLMPGMWDYAMRIKNMDKAGVDIAIVSLTCPNVFWGDRDVSLRAARIVNDSMAEQQRANPDRIRWFASLPCNMRQMPRLSLGGVSKKAPSVSWCSARIHSFFSPPEFQKRNPTVPTDLRSDLGWLPVARRSPFWP
jgi:hypothetical protein